MTTLNISLPDSMRSFVEKQVEAEGFSTASEYVRALIREDQRREAKRLLEDQLMEGILSGPPKKLTGKDLERIRARIGKSVDKSKRRAHR
ncbi:MAG: type II toxin-antitoxin system ParD family antitoxin [Candidatus Hydrogenedentes bacterium]|nr:type II toxin-antitoxin system ParD family antitoxin [Candidatus Hydrogenedentota bacterium]